MMKTKKSYIPYSHSPSNIQWIEVVHATTKAVLLTNNGLKQWFPWSVLVEDLNMRVRCPHEDPRESTLVHPVTIKQWFWNKNQDDLEIFFSYYPETMRLAETPEDYEYTESDGKRSITKVNDRVVVSYESVGVVIIDGVECIYSIHFPDYDNEAIPEIHLILEYVAWSQPNTKHFSRTELFRAAAKEAKAVKANRANVKAQMAKK